MSFDIEKVNELYPGAGPYMFEPMLIAKGTEKSISLAAESGEYFGQIKKDGSLYMLVSTPEGRYCFGRTISKKTGLLTEKSANIPHIMGLLDYFPTGTVLLGEVYYPGKTSRDVTTIMGCLPAKAVERQNGSYGKLHYYLYDMLFIGGKDIRGKGNWDRYTELAIWIAGYQDAMDKYFEENNIELAPVYANNLIERANEALANGEEGMVFKKDDGIYQPGKRPAYNIKVKQSDCIDAFVIGAEKPNRAYIGKEPETWKYWVDKDDNRLPLGTHFGEEGAVAVTKHYYNGWNNAIRIGVYDDNGKIIDIGTVSSGLDDNLRKELSENFSEYNMKVAKIQCMSVDKKDKTLRHAFFKGWHTDKNPEECLAKNVFH